MKVIDNHDEPNEPLDSNATKETNIDQNSSVTETDSSKENKDKDKDNEESKNE